MSARIASLGRSAWHGSQWWLAAPVALTALVAFGVAGTRRLWIDEAFTVYMATMEPSSFWKAVTHHIDAVHATFYLIMRPYILAVGHDPAVLRLPSALFMTLGCVAVVLLARRMAGPRVAVMSGLVFAIQPVTFAYAGDARPSALAVAATAWTTWLYVVLTMRDRTRWWAWLGYAVALAACGYVMLFSFLLAIPHVLAAVAHPPARRHLRSLVLSQVTSLVLLAPLVVVAWGQRGQIGWVMTSPRSAVVQTLVQGWDAGRAAAIALALAALSVAVVGTAAVLRSDRLATTRSRLLVLGWSWALLPGFGLAVVSLWHPVFIGRYIAWCMPGLVLVVGSALALIGRRLVLGAVAIVLVGLSVWTYLVMFPPDRPRDDVIGRLADLASSGDAVYFASNNDELLARVVGRETDLRLLAHPHAFGGTSAVPALTLAEPSADTTTVWLVGTCIRTRGEAEATIKGWGFEPVPETMASCNASRFDRAGSR